MMIMRTIPNNPPRPLPPETADENPQAPLSDGRTSKEIGGPKGPEPTRYGDWEVNGRCTDF
jgi:hypothetical protein